MQKQEPASRKPAAERQREIDQAVQNAEKLFEAWKQGNLREALDEVIDQQEQKK